MLHYEGKVYSKHLVIEAGITLRCLYECIYIVDKTFLYTCYWLHSDTDTDTALSLYHYGCDSFLEGKYV